MFNSSVLILNINTNAYFLDFLCEPLTLLELIE